MDRVLTIDKNQLMEGGVPLILKGVSHPGLEYLHLDLQTMIPETIQFDLNLMAEWKFNAVRLPLRDMHWITNLEYREKVDYWIQSILERHMIVILDLHTQQYHRSQDPFVLRQPGSDGLAFWSQVSQVYGNNSSIFFELFNEPHGISPDTLWHGDDTYYGYKELLLEIRNRSNNICILSGLDWAYQWSFLRTRTDLIQEFHSFSNIMLSTHPYGYRGAPAPTDPTLTLPVPTTLLYPKDGEQFGGDCSMGVTIPTLSPSPLWRESFGFLQEEHLFPMIATEWGLDHPDTSIMGGWYSTELLQYMNSINMSYIAWAWVRERLDYPSLLDPDFAPTGQAITGQQACSLLSNQFYPGPGALIKHDLSQSYWHRLLFFSIPSSSTTLFMPHIFLFFLIPCLFFLLLLRSPFPSPPPFSKTVSFSNPVSTITTSTSTSTNTTATNSIKNTIRWRSRSDTTLVSIASSESITSI